MQDWRRPNRYNVLLSCPTTCDRTVQHRELAPFTTQADLWIEGATPTSPGDAHVTGGVTPTSPGGVTPTSPEPSLEPTMNKGLESNARRTCDVCSLSEVGCKARPNSGHSFTPKGAST
jgi:hypothetical protein